VPDPDDVIENGAEHLRISIARSIGDALGILSAAAIVGGGEQ
jgi:hypothetical protein